MIIHGYWGLYLYIIPGVFVNQPFFYPGGPHLPHGPCPAQNPPTSARLLLDGLFHGTSATRMEEQTGATPSWLRVQLHIYRDHTLAGFLITFPRFSRSPGPIGAFKRQEPEPVDGKPSLVESVTHRSWQELKGQKSSWDSSCIWGVYPLVR